MLQAYRYYLSRQRGPPVHEGMTRSDWPPQLAASELHRSLLAWQGRYPAEVASIVCFV